MNTNGNNKVTTKIYIASEGWINISVDKCFPVENNELVYATSSSKECFWPAILEKALAKQVKHTLIFL